MGNKLRANIFGLLLLIMSLTAVDATAQLNKQYFYYVGRMSLINNHYKEAIQTLNVLLQADRDAHEAYFLRGVAKYNLDDILGAEQDFSVAIEKNPVYTVAYQYRAIARSMLGDYDDALKDFQEAIDLRPDRPEPYYSRGVTFFLSQQFDKAIEDFDMFIRFDSRVADAYINRGTAYLHLRDTLKAFENYNQAIRTNREYTEGYFRRGSLLMAQKKYEEALEDLNKAIECDSTYILPYFNRALVNNNMNRIQEALNDFDQVILIDPSAALAYFNRAIIRTQIGDYNRALEDYNTVATYTPNNVLVYYNRALLYSRLGNYTAALADYDKAIELYPDFANAYLNRSSVKYLLRDPKGADKDKYIAEEKIAEYRSKLNDSTFSIYADTSRKFNQLLSFDSSFSGNSFEQVSEDNELITLKPLFKFSMIQPDTLQKIEIERYYAPRVDEFLDMIDHSLLALTCQQSDIVPDSLIAMNEEYSTGRDWISLFKHGITQNLIKQYTSSINTYTQAIALQPGNPFLYFNRSATRAEMTDFISSIDNSYQRIIIESDPVARLRNNSKRTYNYDDAIEDLNKAAKLYPEWAYIYYNRANLLALSGKFPEAYDDYTHALELHPNLAEAYFNRGLVQIYMKDTRKGCLDISKAGELGIKEAYAVLKRYTMVQNE
ncbi:MAG: tetratricopeptide repeat protein [Tidjanibacter sp.]|nr:tetratricopeptide repeat protein [Tidjanibacter sp.]